MQGCNLEGTLNVLLFDRDLLFFLLTFLEVMVSCLPSNFISNSFLTVKSVRLKFLAIFDAPIVCMQIFGFNIELNLLLLSHSGVDSW